MNTENLLQKIENLAGIIGLYALYNDDQLCVYVGKADCLKSRLKTHIKKRSDIVAIGIVDLRKQASGMDYENTKAYLRFKEAQLIESLNPIENIMRPKITPEYWQSLPVEAARQVINELK